jgi:hypothetical protein
MDLTPAAEDDFFNQGDSPEGFFDNIPDAPPPVPSPAPDARDPRGASANGGPSEPATPLGDGMAVAAAAEGEEDIQKALFVGNYDGAVEVCFKVRWSCLGEGRRALCTVTECL